MGKSKAQAYRESYGADKAPRTITTRPYIMMQDERIKREIEALELAEKAAAYRTPAKLREFVIQTLLEVALDPETKAAVRVQAVKTLGTVTEVAAFTERKEVRTISTSEAARAKVLDEIKAIMAGDDSVVDVQAKSLLDELQAQDTSAEFGNVAKTGADTGAEYEHAQVIDSYSGACQDGEQSAGKDGSRPPKPGETLGGVSEGMDGQPGDEGQDRDPTVPHPPES